jgi:hypothetical protein
MVSLHPGHLFPNYPPKTEYHETSTNGHADTNQVKPDESVYQAVTHSHGSFARAIAAFAVITTSLNFLRAADLSAQSGVL